MSLSNPLDFQNYLIGFPMKRSDARLLQDFLNSSEGAKFRQVHRIARSPKRTNLSKYLKSLT